MDPILQEMRDHHEIRTLLAQYCHGCDRGDAALMASVYAGEGSFDDHGHVHASGPDFARIMGAMIKEQVEVVSHILGQSLIKVDGDTAGAETFFLALTQMAEGDGASILNHIVGRFIDRLERVDGHWKIRHRTAIRDTSITLPITRDDPARYQMKAGHRDASDLGVILLGIAHRS